MLGLVSSLSQTVLRSNPLIPLGQYTCSAMLNKVETGEIVFSDKSQTKAEDKVYGKAATFHGKPLRATLTVLNTSFYMRLLMKADLGFAESFILGELEIDSLTNLLIILIQNRDHMNNLTVQTAAVHNLISYITHSRLANTIVNAMSNIGAHYDLGNELFSSFLDNTMMYSSAVWMNASESLSDAQMRKIEMMLDKANILENEDVLEIGTGWGTFAIEAVKRRHCRITSVTLSKEQYDYALEQIDMLPVELSSRITVLLTDYRTLPELFPGKHFDKIVSIEMIEAVGREFLSSYFSVCNQLLHPEHGIMVFQCITMPETRYDAYCRSADFIQTYIFPGGHCPSVTQLMLSINEGSAGSLMIDDVENIGPHYSRTLRLWREAFLKNYDERLKPFPKYLSVNDKEKVPFYSEEFKRKWLYYFCYCEAGFATRTIGNIQMILTRECNSQLVQGKADIML